MLTFYNFIYRENRGGQIRGGRPNPLADLVPRGKTKSASGFGPEGPDPLADLDRGDQIRGDTGRIYFGFQKTH